MNDAASAFEQRIDPLGKRSRRSCPASVQATVFMPEAVLVDPNLALAAEPERVQWRASALAALHALEAHGYGVLLNAMPGGPDGPDSRSVGFNRSLLQRLALEADVHPVGILAIADADALPAVLREAAAAHGLDLRRAWFLSWDEALGTASRRVGCRSVRLLEPGRQARRRWPLLRGHVPMKLMDAVVYVLRCDGHLAEGQSLPSRMRRVGEGDTGAVGA
ncbi:hypothetical protein ACS5PK_01295 [Roseateles sp. DB2]|uniref:hypothetical protein n=1 Tax=Roseateles sp. DB2 TaxID=3453717 RepID=UPI003EF04D82